MPEIDVAQARAMFKILYHDIGWDVHVADIFADTIEDAIQSLLAACTCTLSEIITYYEG